MALMYVRYIHHINLNIHCIYCVIILNPLAGVVELYYSSLSQKGLKPGFWALQTISWMAQTNHELGSMKQPSINNQQYNDKTG